MLCGKSKLRFQACSSLLTKSTGSQPSVCCWSLSLRALVHGVSRILCEILDESMLIFHPAASYAVASEASSYSLRAKTQGLGWLSYGLGTMVLGLVMPYLYVSTLIHYLWSPSRIESIAYLCLLAEPRCRKPRVIHRLHILRTFRSRAGWDFLSHS